MGIFSTIANIGMGLSTIAGSADNAELTNYNLAIIAQKEKTEVQAVKAKTAFDSNAFMVEMKTANVLNSRENLDGDPNPPKTATEIIAKFNELSDVETILTYIDDNYENWSIEVINELLNPAKNLNFAKNEQIQNQLKKVLNIKEKENLAKIAKQVNEIKSLLTEIESAPHINDETAHKIMSQGQQLLNLFAELDTKTLAKNNITAKDLQKTLDNLHKVQHHWTDAFNSAETTRMKTNYDDIRLKAIARQARVDKYGKETGEMLDALGKIKRTLKAQAEYEKLAKFREKGVSDINEVKNNPKLNELFKELQMTWTIENGVIKIFVNRDLNKKEIYKLFDPSFDKSYVLYENPDKKGLAISKIKLNGKKYSIMLLKEEDKVAHYSKNPTNKDFRKVKSLILSPTTTQIPAKKIVANNGVVKN